MVREWGQVLRMPGPATKLVEEVFAKPLRFVRSTDPRSCR